MASIAARAARLPGRGARLVLLLARVPLLGLVSLLALVPILAGAVTAAPARAAVPPPLSGDLTVADISSTYGSGVFGRWSVDPFGLPVYDYTLDQQTSPLGPQAELGGNRDAWHQVGNDRVVADAYNHGYVQMWSQDRLYQWMNHYDASSQHYAGGYGYLRVGGRTYSTLYDDRPPGAATTRRFGPGYYEKTTQAGPIAVTQRVYAPFGDDPLLLDEVTLRNTSSAAQTPSWFEYWDVNPAGPPGFGPRATGSPSYDAGTRTLSVAQLPNAVDTAPLSI